MAARRIECGAVNVNSVLFNFLAPGVPMGGWKESGIGYRHAEYGIRKYCRSGSTTPGISQAKPCRCCLTARSSSVHHVINRTRPEFLSGALILNSTVRSVTRCSSIRKHPG